MKFHLIKLCFLCVLLVSCNTSKEIVYFQDIVVNQPEAIIGARDITVQPKDQISIMVDMIPVWKKWIFTVTQPVNNHTYHIKHWYNQKKKKLSQCYRERHSLSLDRTYSDG